MSSTASSLSSPSTGPGVSPRAALWGEIRQLLRLAFPLAFAHAGNQLLAIVDTIMVGRLPAGTLGGLSMGNGLHNTVTMFGLGICLGIEPIVSQAIGAGEEQHARRALWDGVYIAGLISLPLMLLVLVSPSLLLPVGVDPYAARQAKLYVFGRVASVLPFLLFVVERAYLQAKHATGPIVWAVIIANLANVLFNFLFIYGDECLSWIGLPGIGLPALGVLGAGLATTLVSILQAVILARAIAKIPVAPDPQRRRLSWPDLARVFRLGIPTGSYILLEIAFFVSGGVVAGTLGSAAVDGHQVVLSVASFTFTVSLGIAAAGGTRVGLHIGRRDHLGARRAGVLALVLGAGFMSMAAISFLTLTGPLARLFSTHASVVRVAVTLFPVAAVFQLSDGVQVVAAGILRGAGDTRSPVYVNLIGHWFVGAPVIYWLVFHAHLGPVGIYWGFFAGLTAVGVPLVLLFWRLCSRPVARV